MILGLVAAIGLLIDDFMTWKEGGESFINWNAWSQEIALAEQGVSFIKGILENWFMFLFGMVDGLVKLFTGDFSGAWTAVSIAIESFLAIGKSAWEVIKGIGEAIGLTDGAALTPSPSEASSMSGGGQSVNQNTQIVVQGSADPGATARAVAGAQGTVNGDMARNLKGAAR